MCWLAQTFILQKSFDKCVRIFCSGSGLISSRCVSFEDNKKNVQINSKFSGYHTFVSIFKWFRIKKEATWMKKLRKISKVSDGNFLSAFVLSCLMFPFGVFVFFFFFVFPPSNIIPEPFFPSFTHRVRAFFCFVVVTAALKFETQFEAFSEQLLLERLFKRVRDDFMEIREILVITFLVNFQILTFFLVFHHKFLFWSLSIKFNLKNLHFCPFYFAPQPTQPEKGRVEKIFFH